MPRGGTPDRGRGRGRGRGGGGGGARGRGGRGRGRGSGMSSVFDIMGDIDFNMIQYPAEGGRGRGIAFPRARGRGDFTPRGRGRGGDFGGNTPRGRGRGRGDSDSGANRGRGGSGARPGPNAPLSAHLYAKRPFLRPVVFVRSKLHATLFQEKEEIFEAQPEEPDDDHVPTANRITQIFNTNAEASGSSSDGGEEMEEIDWNDMGSFQAQVDSKSASATPANEAATVPVLEEKFTGFFIDSNPEAMVIVVEEEEEEIGTVVESVPPAPAGFFIDSIPEAMVIVVEEEEEEEIGTVVESAPPAPESTAFYIDSHPAPYSNDGIAVEAHAFAPMGVAEEESEETIVFVAPHPRVSSTPRPPVESPLPSALPSRSILADISHMNVVPTPELPQIHVDAPLQQAAPPPPPNGLPVIPVAPAFDSITFTFANRSSPRKQPHVPPISKSKAKAKKREARSSRRKAEKRSMFGRGAETSEHQVRGQGPDKRWEERRQGDSDLDWGTADLDSDSNVVVGVADGMQVDPDLDIDYATMARFAKGMGQSGSRHMTLDDFEDLEKMGEEDRNRGRSGGVGSSRASSSGEDEEEENAVVNEEEEMEIAEPLDLELVEDSTDSDSSDDSDDDGDDMASPRTGFQASLEKIRNRAKGKGKRPAQTKPGSDDEDDDFFDSTKGDEDEDFLAELQNILDENEGILMDRKARNQLFRAVRDGDFSDIEEVGPATRKKDKGKHIPPALQEQWERDRARKADFKRSRELAKLERAADPLAMKKGGKKGRKAMLAAAKLDPSIIVPHRILNLEGVELQIRRFIADVGGPHVMSLPPMDKTTRKNVHKLAVCFNLKSISKGKADNRYTSLTKTTRSGIAVNEKTVRALIRRSGGGYSGAGTGGYVGSGAYKSDKGGGGKSAVPRHKDGDLVGKTAPKLGSTNLGYKMLALMGAGWSEGDKIGLSGGIDQPITATIKNTKLGLGASFK